MFNITFCFGEVAFWTIYSKPFEDLNLSMCSAQSLLWFPDHNIYQIYPGSRRQIFGGKKVLQHIMITVHTSISLMYLCL
jgi:hypothetical protein